MLSIIKQIVKEENFKNKEPKPVRCYKCGTGNQMYICEACGFNLVDLMKHVNRE